METSCIHNFAKGISTMCEIQSRPGFEHGPPCLFPTTITITPWTHRKSKQKLFDSIKRYFALQYLVWTGATPSDCLVSYPEHSLGELYLSAEMQSVYSTAPADWDENTVQNSAKNCLLSVSIPTGSNQSSSNKDGVAAAR